MATDQTVIDLKKWGPCRLLKESYNNGRLALQLFSDMHGMIATLTVNLPEEHLEDGEFFVKGWSENEVIIPDVLASGVFEDTGKRVHTGYVRASVWKFAKKTAKGKKKDV